jgi:hypothetical protein
MRVHFDLWYPVPLTKGGRRYGQCARRRRPDPPMEVLRLTNLTLEEFQPLLLPFEATFQAYTAYWRLNGQPHTARRYTTSKQGRPMNGFTSC